MVPKAEKRKSNYGLLKLIVIFVTLFQYMILSQISVKRMLQLVLRRACRLLGMMNLFAIIKNGLIHCLTILVSVSRESLKVFVRSKLIFGVDIPPCGGLV